MDIVLSDDAAIKQTSLSGIEIEFTIAEVAAGKTPLSKTFGISEAGAILATQRGVQPSAGQMRRRSLRGSAGEVLSALGRELETLSCREALILAPPARAGDLHPFVTKDEALTRPDAIARTKEHFPAMAGPMLFGLDFDLKEWPAGYRDRIRGDLIENVLAQVFPQFTSAASLRRPSASAGIRARGGDVVSGEDSGLHWFFLVRDGSDIDRFVRALHQRLVLAGYGFAQVFDSGSVDIRSLVDVAASASVSRFWFEGSAVLADDRLEFVPGGRAASVWNVDGAPIDTRKLPSLSEAETDRFLSVCAELTAGVAEQAKAKRQAWRDKREADFIDRGATREEAHAMVYALRERKHLTGDFVVVYDDDSSATVNEILDDPQAFHGATLPDPLEPDYGGGRNLAICYSDSYPRKIYSHAHGGTTYYLVRDPASFYEAQASAPEAEHAVAIGLFDTTGDVALADRVPHDLLGHSDPGDLATPPAGSLPFTLERFVRTEARRKGVPEAFTAGAAVTTVASVIGNSLRLQVRQFDTGWTEPAGLWLVLVAPPGSTKSPTINEAVRPIHDQDRDFRRVWKPVHDEWERASKALRSRRKDAVDPGPEPICARRALDNFTTERAIQICASNPRGLIVTPDELSAFLGGIGVYKRSGEGDRAQMLRFFDGGSVTVDRVGSGTLSAESALLSILAGVQPDKLQTMIGELGIDGMLQRFLPIVHDGIERQGVDERPDQDALAGYACMVRSLSITDYAFPSPLRLSPEAGRRMTEGLAGVQRMKHLPNLNSAWSGHLEKWGKILPRIVLTFHCVREFERRRTVDPSRLIDVATVDMALRFAHFLLRHGLAFYERFSASQSRDEAEVAAFLLTVPELRVVSRRDIYQGHRALRGEENRRALSNVMANLTAANWLEVLETTPAEGPTRWLVNPAIHVRFREHARRALAERDVRRGRIQEAAEARRHISGNWTASVSDVFG